MSVSYRFKDYFFPFETIKLRTFLNKSEKYSKNQLIEYQNERIHYLVNYAYNNVPYYTKLFNDGGINPETIKTIEDIKKIPILTKDIVRDNFDQLISKECKKYNPRLVTTSGSTGTPLKFYIDNNSRKAMFCFLWRIWGWSGYKIGQRWTNVKCGVQDPKELYQLSRSLNCLHIASKNISYENSQKILTKLVSFKPKMMCGFPSSIYQFARFVEDNKMINHIKLNNIVTNSETLLPYQREYIEKVFRCNVYDLYSQWEHVCMIGECKEKIKHHQMEYGLLELLDKAGDEVNIGDKGEIVATGFYNLTMPFIRYRTRDLAVKSDKKCKCGREHDIITKIDGRIEDMLITTDGKYISGSGVGNAVQYNNGFDYVQIIQNEQSSIDVKIVKNNLFEEKEMKTTEKHFRDFLGEDMKINYEFVDKIEKSKSGKIRFIINNINKK